MKFIFEVEMRPGHSVEEYARVWCETSELIQQSAGALGTYLHRSLNDPHKLLAIAHWTSKAARDSKHDSATVREILERHAHICDVRIIGEFDEPEWQVIPQATSLDPE